MIMITSGSNAKVKELVKLQKNHKERKKSGLFVAEGEKLIREAALHGKLQAVYVSETVYRKADLGQKAFFGDLSCEVVADSVFNDIADTVTPQGFLGVVEQPGYSLGQIAQEKEKGILLLDGLRDPGNMGTILRTAEGAGMSGVILSRDSVDMFNPKVVRATMGAIFRMPFCYVEDLAGTVSYLRSRGIPVYGTRMEGSLLYDEVDYRAGAGIVVGNEAKGISENVLKQLTGSVRIPMAGKLESLNAAVSAAILMYEMARQRRWHQAGKDGG